jgi:predicted nucleic acid-binding protein
VITAVDTSVLLDVFTADATHGPRSQRALARCLAEGRIVACEVVWAEVGSAFADEPSARAALAALPVDFDGLDEEAALEAGRIFRDYRQRGGRRERVVADFLVGAHAGQRADRLLTRDRGFYRAYFQRLAVVDPAAE